jgi:predicted Zn-dependent protease
MISLFGRWRKTGFPAVSGWIPLLPALFLGVAAAQAPDTAAPPASAAVSEAQQAYARANEFFEQKNLAQSVAALEEALSADPRYVPALTLKAKIAISANRLEIAGECLKRAVEADPASWYVRFLYGFWYYLRGDWPRSISELQAARKLNPRDAHTSLYLGMAYERLGDARTALTYDEQAVKLAEAAGAPDPYTLVAYSRVLQALGRLDDCAKVVNRALTLFPNHRDLYYELGQLLLKKGDPKGAVKAGEAALQLPIEDVAEVQIHYLLARAYQADGDERRAAEHAAAIRAAQAQDGR